MHKPSLKLNFDTLAREGTGTGRARGDIGVPYVGAIDFLVAALPHFEVSILSDRYRWWTGRRTMKRWLAGYAEAHFAAQRDIYQRAGEPTVGFLLDVEATTWTSWAVVCQDAAIRLVYAIKWPRERPQKLATIDDRPLPLVPGHYPNSDTLARLAFRVPG